MRRYIGCRYDHLFGVEAKTAVAERLPCPDPSHGARSDLIQIPLLDESASWGDLPSNRATMTIAVFRRSKWWADKTGVLVWGWDDAAPSPERQKTETGR